MSENGETYTAGKNFTLPPEVTALTNSTSASSRMTKDGLYQDVGAWGRKEERGFRNESFNFHSSSSGVEKVKVKVLSDH